jgi:hypothetical protein
MDSDGAQAVNEPHLTKFRWKTVLKFAIPAAFLVCFGSLLLKPQSNPPGFSVGPPLPPGRVTPQISYNYGNAVACIGSDGSLWRWETLPNPPQTPREAPKRTGSDSNWCQVAVILAHALALKTDGSLWAWGGNRCGALAQPDAGLQTIEPVRIGSDTNWTHIAVGAGHCLALKRDGSLWAWGQNDRGQVGDGTASNQFAITQIGSDHDWSRISAGDFTSFGLKNDGSVWGWGFSNGPAGDQLLPRRMETRGKIIDISANNFLLLALRSDGTLWICGPNASSAASAYVKASTPNLIQIGKDNDWTEIYAGTCGFFARKKDSSWWFSGMMTNSITVAGPRRLSARFDPWSYAPKLGDALLLTRDGTIWMLTIEPDTGKYATAVKKVKSLLNQASTILPGRPKLFDLNNNFPIRPCFEKIWTLPAEPSREENKPQ